MLRRQFLQTAPAVVTARAATRQSDILIVIGDDHTWSDISCAGSTVVKTPNIDSIARDGVRFTHAFTGTAMCSPMRQQMMTGIFPIRNGAYPNHSQIKPGIKTWPAYFKELGYRVGLAGKRHFGPPKSYPYEFVGGANGDPDYGAMEEFIRRDSKQPYCLLVTSHEPHGPHDKGDPSHFPVDQMKVPWYWVDTPETRKTLAAYYAEIEYLDDQVGKCLKLAGRDAITMYCSEQGNGLPFSKWSCYDLGLRQTVNLRWPGRIKPGTLSHAMVQGVDWLPTLLEAAGGKAPADIDGRSFLDVIDGKRTQHAQEVFGVHTTRGIIAGSPCYPIRSIRTRNRKLILNLKHESKFQCVIQSSEYWPSWVEKAKTDQAAERIVKRFERRRAVEFYDLDKDPHEQNNVAEQPMFAREIDSMTNRLKAWMEQQGDLGVETEMKVAANARGAAE